MSDEIKIKKSDVWKYATFLLIAIVIVGGILVFAHKSSSSKGAANSGTQPQQKADLGVFLNDAKLFPSLGPSNAKNVVVEFSDFQCIWCGLASGLPSWANTNTTSKTAQQMISQSGDMVGSIGKVENLAKQGSLRFVYVPVSFFGAESTYAAEAGFCAANQDKFWQMHDLIFKNAGSDPQENTGKYSKKNLINLARSIQGLNIDTFSSCLNNDDTLNQVQTVLSDAQKFGIKGTPSVYVNGKSVSPTWSAIQSALK